MTEDKKQKLAQLLHESLSNNLEIRVTQEYANNYQIPLTMNLNEYKRMLQAYWIHHRVNDIHLLLYIEPYELHIANDATKSKFLDFIRQEFSEFIHKDRIQTISAIIKGGVPNDGYHLDRLLKQILKIAIVFDIERAVLDFEKITKNTPLSWQYLTILDGIQVKQEIQVFDHIKLVPIPNNVSEFPYYFPYIPKIPSNYFAGKTLFVIDNSISPIFFKPCQTDEMCKEIYNNNTHIGNFDFCDEFFHALSLTCNFAIQPTIRWSFMKPYEICHLTESSSSALTIPEYITDHSWLDSKIIEKAQIDEAKSLHKVLNKRDSDFKEKLKIPIKRWLKSKTSRTDTDKIIDLGIAFESLYLSDRDGNSELSFQFRLRASWYLGKNKPDRELLMDEFKAIYTLRSKAVHTGKIPQTVKIRSKSVPISEFIPKSQDLCRQSIMKMIEKGAFPDLNNEILGCE